MSIRTCQSSLRLCHQSRRLRTETWPLRTSPAPAQALRCMGTCAAGGAEVRRKRKGTVTDRHRPCWRRSTMTRPPLPHPPPHLPAGPHGRQVARGARDVALVPRQRPAGPARHQQHPAGGGKSAAVQCKHLMSGDGGRWLSVVRVAVAAAPDSTFRDTHPAPICWLYIVVGAITCN